MNKLIFPSVPILFSYVKLRNGESKSTEIQMLVMEKKKKKKVTFFPHEKGQSKTSIKVN